MSNGILETVSRSATFWSEPVARDYYVILGIPADADQKQIRSAYRERVKELHPDYYGKNCDTFLALQEAYSVLRDPTRRRQYDRSKKETPARSGIVEIRTPSSSRRPPIEAIMPSCMPPIEEVLPHRSAGSAGPIVEEFFDLMVRRIYNRG